MDNPTPPAALLRRAYALIAHIADPRLHEDPPGDVAQVDPVAFARAVAHAAVTLTGDQMIDVPGYEKGRRVAVLARAYARLANPVEDV